jgi:hypothetical protein
MLIAVASMVLGVAVVATRVPAPHATSCVAGSGTRWVATIFGFGNRCASEAD